MAGEVHFIGERSEELAHAVGLPASSYSTLSTKYYTAKVHVHALTSPLLAGSGAPEAAVTSFHLQNAQPAIENASKVDHSDVKLAVMLTGSFETAREDESEESIRQWCVSNGFELIRACLDDNDVDAQLAESSSEGTARVIEAIKSHIWSTASIAGGNADEEEQQNSEEDDGNDEDEGGEHDELERMMSQMMRLREIGSQLNDEERRQRAASLAQEFMGRIVGDNESDAGQSRNSSTDDDNDNNP